ncbi:aminopeptidase [Hymenobacter sp. NBH84]|uniref:M1 family metallopeptidase n=1 Tax=Hymenobacter sp. NBH84 TaxID=2596915 RepID=UPI0016259D29|nr:M1 family aminopeptidase [Hymenobacter sp. NBH84]QNE40042.1 aminopeptidase [Hymenobacter sp. NBH84]
MLSAKHLLLLLPFLPTLGHAQTPAITTGVSQELAQHRAQVLRQVAYKLHFNVPPQVTEPIPATEEITFQLLDNAAPLQLDFKEKPDHVGRITVNGQPQPLTVQQEHLVIPASALRVGENRVAIDFTAGDLSLNRNPEYLYTLLVPDRARTVFPCFDQPDVKAVFHLTLTVPAEWQAVANGPVADSSRVGARQTYRFQPSDTISTYLFAFVAGKFRRTVRQPEGRPMHLYYRETDQDKISRSLGPIFDIQAGALKFLTDYTQIPYPFRKFDFAALPDFQYGGMEHAGAIDYKASTLFLDEGATRDQLNARANLLAHETAHMWFGDLVTMRWFNDVWTKEVFANFMADKISEVTQPDGNFDLKFLTDHYPAAYAVDRTAGANPIRQPLDNLQDAGSLYGNIIYHKAPIMMRQLERLMGQEAFRDGLRTYLKRYAYHNATWPDLIQILDERTPTDLQAWNKVWVNEPGRPQFDYWLRVQNGKIKRFNIDQKGEEGSRRVWPQQFEVALVYADHVEELTVDMRADKVRVREAEGKAAPRFIVFNSSGQGYGLFPVDEQSLSYLGQLQSPVMRAAVYINLTENMLSGRAVSPAQLLALVRPLLAQESEELNLNLLLDQLTTVFWRFTPPAQRPTLAATLEPELWQAMQQVGAPNKKKQLFKTYASIALSQAAQDRLHTIWQTKQPPAGVKLSEDDYTDLAAVLALRAYPGHQQILQTQLQRIQNPDRRLRLQYLLPALSDDVATRDGFFAGLAEEKNREKEAWVLSALGYLHHPLRAATSEKYLPQSLALLETIQRTGDIFFPQSWLQATFRWYQTPTAATIIRDFLQGNPTYNPKLKAKVLQAADNVFRAEKLVGEKGGTAAGQ